MRIELPHSAMVRGVGPALVLLYLAFAAYFPAISGRFIWDDVDIYIVNNPMLRAPDGLYQFWFTSKPIDYYPLTYSSFWLEWQLWGIQSRPYHLLNIALHGGCGIILWRLLRRLGFAWAWLAAALFVLHPVNVESVAWVSQRKGVLAAFFGFLTLLWYVRWQAQRQRRWIILAVMAFALSLSAKPTLITLPVFFLLWEVWRERRLHLGIVRPLLPMFLVALMFGAIGLWFQEFRVLADTDAREQGVVARLLTVGWSFWFYVWKTIWPLELSIVYPRWDIDPLKATHYLPIAAMVTGAFFAWKLTEPWRTAVVGAFGYYIVTMLPILGFVDVYYWMFSFVADHYQYQSIGALIALALWLVAALSSRFKPLHRAVKIASIVAVLAVMFGLTWSRAGLYADSERLWKDAIAKNDKDYVARINLTRDYILLDDWDSGCEVALHPSVLASRVTGGAINAGWCLYRQEKFADALSEFERALRLSPHDPDMYKLLKYMRGRIAREIDGRAGAEKEAVPASVERR